MDKQEYKLRAEQIKDLISKREFLKAVKIADEIDWTRVRSVTMLCRVSDLYKVNRRFKESKELLLMAYERKPEGRTIVYSLCELCLKTGELVQAVEYFKKYVNLAPMDNSRFILQYKLYEAQNVSLEERIAVLEELKKREYREKWGYELAYLYHRIGLVTKCVEECDQLILWFSDGRYVKKAMELKRLHQPLTSVQEANYNAFVGKDAVLPRPEVSVPMNEEKTEEQIEENKHTEIHEDEIQVRPVKVGEYDTINLQKELASRVLEVLEPSTGEQEIFYEDNTGNMKEIFCEEPAVPAMARVENEVEPGYDDRESEATKEIPSIEDFMSQRLSGFQQKQEVNYSDEYSKVEVPREMENVLSQEYDGQISLVIPKPAMVEKQITGQMNLHDTLLQWEKDKEKLQEKHRENLKQKLLEQTGKISLDFNMIEENNSEAVQQNRNDERSISESGTEDRSKGIPGQAMGELSAGEDTVKKDSPTEELINEFTRLSEEIDRKPSDYNGHKEDCRENNYNHKNEPSVSELIQSYGDKEVAERNVGADQNNVVEEVYKETAQNNVVQKAFDEIVQNDVVQEECDEVVQNDVVQEECDEIAQNDEAQETCDEMDQNDEAQETCDEKSREDMIKKQSGETTQGHVVEAESGNKEEEPSENKVNYTETLQKVARAIEGERELTEEEKTLFAPFIQTKGARRKLLKAIDMITLSPYTGNVIVTGEADSDTLKLAKNIMKCYQMSDDNFSGVIAKVMGSSLNSKSVEATIKKLNNGGLIIEKASGMNSQAVAKLLKALDQDQTGIVVILEDNKRAIKRMLAAYPAMEPFFNARVEIQILSTSELANYGKQYAAQKEYTIDALGMLALETRIENEQTSNHAVTVVEVREIVDAAIHRVNRKNISHLFDLILGKRYDDENMIILREKDFV